MKELADESNVPYEYFEKAVLHVLKDRTKNRNFEDPIKIEVEMDTNSCVMFFYINSDIIENAKELEDVKLLNEWLFSINGYYTFLVNKHMTNIDDALDSNSREIGIQILKSLNEKTNTTQTLTLNNVKKLIDNIYDGIFK
jgi:hypothetical protein